MTWVTNINGVIMYFADLDNSLIYLLSRLE